MKQFLAPLDKALFKCLKMVKLNEIWYKFLGSRCWSGPYFDLKLLSDNCWFWLLKAYFRFLLTKHWVGAISWLRLAYGQSFGRPIGHLFEVPFWLARPTFDWESQTQSSLTGLRPVGLDWDVKRFAHLASLNSLIFLHFPYIRQV